MATKTVTLTDTAYTLIGSGPMLMDVRGGTRARVFFGTSAPAIDTDAYHDLKTDRPIAYSGSESVYALLVKEYASGDSIVVTEVA